MLFPIILVTTILFSTITADAHEDGFGEGFVEMKTTCYCPESCPGKITALGYPVRYGICSVKAEMMSEDMVAIVYTMDGEFLGYFEPVDTGGAEGIKTGIVIDVWQPNLSEATAWMKKTGGRVKVKFVEAYG